MPLGQGFWFDRRNRRFHKITEHASDAIDKPGRFRARPVANLNPVRDRDAIVRHVASNDFIRVRLWKNHLGWEFDGRPDDALDVLVRFIVKYEVGPVVLVNISDFASGISIVVSASTVLATTSAANLGLSKPKGSGSHGPSCHSRS
jgi:hypothetical protein